MSDRQILLDTNQLLNAAFMPESIARTAVDALAARGATLLLADHSSAEARSVLARLCGYIHPAFDPWPLVQDFVASYALESIATPEGDGFESVNLADRPIARAAAASGAALLTSDAPFQAQSIKVGLSALSPWEVVWSAYPERLEVLVRLKPLHRNTGLIFGRVRLPWFTGVTPIDHEATVVDCEGLGRIFLDARAREWRFEGDDERRLAVPANRTPVQWVVALSYRETSDGTLTTTFRVAADNERLGQQTRSSKRPDVPVLGMTFGHSRAHQHYLNGHIQCLVTGAEPLKSENWSAYVETSGAAPDPWDTDTLRQALRRLWLQDGHRWQRSYGVLGSR